MVPSENEFDTPALGNCDNNAYLLVWAEDWVG